jgi:hypothetical protein
MSMPGVKQFGFYAAAYASVGYMAMYWLLGRLFVYSMVLALLLMPVWAVAEGMAWLWK